MSDDQLFSSIELFLGEDGGALPHPNDIFGISSATEQTAPPQLPAAESPSAKPTRSKQPRRVELPQLRDEAARLEAVRDVLAKRARRSQPHTHQASSSLQSDKTGEYKQLANEQLQRFELSMRENLELRANLTALTEMGKKLRRQLKQQQALLAQELSSSSGTVHSSEANPLLLDQVQVYFMMLSVLPRLYELTQAQIEDPQLQLELGAVRVHESQYHNRSEVLDIVDARVVPFDRRATADAVWEWMCGDKSTFCNVHVQRIVEENSTMQMSFSGQVAMGEVRLRCQGIVVLRRYEERDRVVFVTTARVAPQGSEAGDGVINHSQWIVVSHNPSRRCSEILCRDMSELADGKVKMSAVQAGIKEHHEMMHVFVDNKIIDASRNSS